MSDLDFRLAALEARLAIQDIVCRYARAVDARDLDALVGLFAADVALGGGQSGRAALADQLRPTLRGFYRSMHHVTGQVVDLEGPDAAAGTVYCRAEHECGDRWVVVAICYFDRYVRQEGGWYFAGRQARSVYHADMARGPVPPYDVWPGREGHDRRGNLPQRWPSWGTFWDAAPDGLVPSLTRVP